MPLLLVLGVAWLIGLVLGRSAPAPLVILWLVGGLGLALLQGQRWPQRRRLGLAGLVLLLGLWRGWPPPPTVPPPLPTTVGAVRAVVLDWPRPSERGQQATLAVSAVAIDGRWQPLSSRLLAYLPPLPALLPGDSIETDGRLRPLASLADRRLAERWQRDELAGQWLARRVSRFAAEPSAVPAEPLRAARQRIVALLDRHLPVTVAALAAGLLVGERATLAPHLYEAFVITGTVHLLVVSGANMSLVAGLAGWLGSRLGQRGRPLWLALTLGLLTLYTLLAGAEPPVVRAALMGGLAAGAQAFGRPADPLLGLVLTVAVMAGWQPTLLAELSFQLSALATLGLVLALPSLAPWLARRHWSVRLLAEPLAATLAAGLAIEPLLAMTFGRLSLVAPVVNLLAVPWVPLVMAGATLTALSGLLGLPGLTELLASGTTLVAYPLLLAVEWGAALPWASLTVPPPTPEVVVLLYGLLALLASPGLTTHPGAAVRRWCQALPAVAAPLTLAGLALGAGAVWLALLR